MLKALFIHDIFIFLFCLFCYAEKQLDEKDKVNFKMYDVTDCTASFYNTHIVQYLKK